MQGNISHHLWSRRRKRRIAAGQFHVSSDSGCHLCMDMMGKLVQSRILRLMKFWMWTQIQSWFPEKREERSQTQHFQLRRLDFHSKFQAYCSLKAQKLLKMSELSCIRSMEKFNSLIIQMLENQQIGNKINAFVAGVINIDRMEEVVFLLMLHTWVCTGYCLCKANLFPVVCCHTLDPSLSLLCCG